MGGIVYVIDSAVFGLSTYWSVPEIQNSRSKSKFVGRIFRPLDQLKPIDPLARCLTVADTRAIKYEIIEIKFDLHHKLHNKWKTYWSLDYWFFF